MNYSDAKKQKFELLMDYLDEPDRDPAMGSLKDLLKDSSPTPTPKAIPNLPSQNKFLESPFKRKKK